MQKISAYILTFNEAEKIKAAIETVLWADEIVVVDSDSTDGTPDIATSLGARVVQVPFKGFGDLRNQADRSLPVRVDFQPRCRRTLHRGGARRDPRYPGRSGALTTSTACRAGIT